MNKTLHRRPSRRKRRHSTIFGSCLAVLLLFLFYKGHRWSSLWRASPTSIPVGHVTSVSANPLLEQHAKLWRSLFHVILNNDPQCKNPPDIVIPEKLDIAYEIDHIHNRPDILWVEDADLQRLKIAHQNYLRDIQKLKLIYVPGTRGIITTVADTAIPVLLIQLRMLRSAESALPVEVFLTKPTLYTEYVCKVVLLKLNASCIYFSDIFTASGTGVDVEHYQYKILAILFSSFDEVLLLDSDAWPITNPDHLFTYPPFTDTGLVIWPDFWYASESPYFFQIAKVENPPLLHTSPSTEAGEIMYAKSKHQNSILLATYYNYYGPQYYYPLQSQGAPGQGDKETFGLAALVLKEDFYKVKTMVTALGRLDSSHQFVGSAMVQYDPIVDFQQRHTPAHPDQQNLLPEQESTPKLARPPRKTNKPLFIHANFPKFDPRTIFDGQSPPTRDTNGSYVRCWDMSVEAAILRFGLDIEQRFWQAIRAVACDDMIGKDIEPERQVKEIETCHRVEAYVDEVFYKKRPSVTLT